MQQAIELYLDDGRFSMAAKAQKEIAEMYEAENNTDKAIDAFLKAADLYENDKSQRYSALAFSLGNNPCI